MFSQERKNAKTQWRQGAGSAFLRFCVFDKTFFSTAVKVTQLKQVEEESLIRGLPSLLQVSEIDF